MKLKAVAVIILMLLLATACSGETHTTIADALTGNVGDTVELDMVHIEFPTEHVPRSPARDLFRFEGCDAAGDCIRIEVTAASSAQIEQVLAGEHLAQGAFVEVRGGELLDDSGVPYVRAGIVRVLRDVDGWPE